MKNKNRMKACFKQYLGREVAIDYKACLYFFCIMVFYCTYLAFLHIFSASVLYMCQMIAAAYVMGYVQVYILHDFDETEHMGGREILFTFLCSAIYTLVSYLFGWFDKSPLATTSFFIYMLFIYGCIYWCNKIKRTLDTNHLNHLLTDFKNSANKEKNTL